ncbi:hypothetical protein [Butyrivibrio sp. INlla16]|uniref:hypothetical protein n=1 Tax=Butyrivibrio sp. INlla16 TaxID=1520807 RepID=UPI00087FE75F|nr:hypothetical protein [Butyrivibrio sp. INlla16]SDB44162.1 hypothetical protein SAMN02910263_02154 [Butyrivibrio sp. INlla16]
MKKYYDNREDNIAFERWVDVTARLMVKYGPGLLKRLEKENMVLYMIDYEFCTDGAESDSFTNDPDVVLGYSYVVSAA